VAGAAPRRPWEVDDKLWALAEPLLPKMKRRYCHPGASASMTGRRRAGLARSQAWQRLHEVLLARLNTAGMIAGLGQR
jgi:transposase